MISEHISPAAVALRLFDDQAREGIGTGVSVKLRESEADSMLRITRAARLQSRARRVSAQNQPAHADNAER